MPFPPRIHFCSEKIIFKSRVFAVVLAEGKIARSQVTTIPTVLLFTTDLWVCSRLHITASSCMYLFSGRYSLLDMMQ